MLSLSLRHKQKHYAIEEKVRVIDNNIFELSKNDNREQTLLICFVVSVNNIIII